MKTATRLSLRYTLPLFLLLLCSTFVPTTTASSSSEQEEKTPDKNDKAPPPRVLTPEELKVANGVDSDKLYLAIFGRVYDVGAGTDYYGPQGGYRIFAGRDAPVPFITGNFTEEEAANSWTTLETKHHGGLLSWVEFYENEERYPFIGVVQGEFYDADGKPTPELAKVEEALVAAKEVQKQREIERKRKVAEREAKRRANMQTTTPSNRRMAMPLPQQMTTTGSEL